MNDQLWSYGAPFAAVSNMAPVPTDQLWSFGAPFGYIFPTNNSPANFWLVFE